jgi:hypothetical protein
MPFKRYTELYHDVASATVDLLATQFFHNGELSLVLSTAGDVLEASQWRGEIDAKGIERKPPNGGWDWDLLFRGQLKAPKKYCVSIKWNESLCGLLLGAISKGSSVVSIQYLETSPDMTPLSGKIIPISVAFSALLGQRVNASYLAVYGPHDAMAEIVTSDFGFKSIAPYGYRYTGNAPLYRPMAD